MSNEGPPSGGRQSEMSGCCDQKSKQKDSRLVGEGRIADMTELELVDRIKLEEDTLCSLPYDPQYKMRRDELTKLVNLHRAMLVDIVRSQDGCIGEDEADMASRTASPSKSRNSDNDCYALEGSDTGEEREEVRVLVVESEPITALLLRLVLENRGYAVREVGSRAEAVIETGRWAPDVIVTECPIPDAGSVDFVANVRAEVGAGILVIGTGPNMSHLSGYDALFARPFEAEEVAREVDSLTGEATDEPIARCASAPAALDVRRRVLCDIRRRLTAIDMRIENCDSGSDATLYRILTLVSAVDDWATFNALQLEIVSPR